MKKAIILSAGPLALGIVRSLGIKGIKSIVIYQSKYDVAQDSKYCIEKVKIKDFLDKKEIFDLLIQKKDIWTNNLIIPASDETIIALSYYKIQLKKYYKFSIPDYNVIKKIVNKEYMYEIAKKANIPILITFFPKKLDDLKKIKNKIKFPCILKPLERHLFYPIFQKKLFIINSYDELFDKYQLCEKHKLKVMITELIPGDDQDLISLVSNIKNGKITNPFLFKKIRQTPPFFGLARVCVSIKDEEIKNQLIEYISKFIKIEKNFYGNCSFEFKYDKRDNKFKFIEVNGRIILNVILSTACGINYPYILYEDITNNNFINITNYQENIYWINLKEDLKESIFHQRPSFKEFFRPYFSKKVFAYESIKDPRPILNHWKNNFFNVFRKEKYYFFKK